MTKKFKLGDYVTVHSAGPDLDGLVFRLDGKIAEYPDVSFFIAGIRDHRATFVNERGTHLSIISSCLNALPKEEWYKYEQDVWNPNGQREA